MTAPDRQRLAVIVPLKDEAEGVPALETAMQRVREQVAAVAKVEFVLVDDGSVDATWDLLQERFAQDAGCRLERHAVNRGLAAAIQTGMRVTDAAVCASIDADLSYDPGELVAMLPLLDGADVVTASPYHPDGGVSGVPGWRLLLSRGLSRCYRLLLRSDVRTWTSCFRVYRRTAVVELPLVHEGFLGTAELLVRVLRRGGRVREHPCVLGVRRFGASKMKIARTIGGHIGLLWQVLLRRVS